MWKQCFIIKLGLNRYFNWALLYYTIKFPTIHDPLWLIEFNRYPRSIIPAQIPISIQNKNLGILNSCWTSRTRLLYIFSLKSRWLARKGLLKILFILSPSHMQFLFEWRNFLWIIVTVVESLSDHSLFVSFWTSKHLF